MELKRGGPHFFYKHIVPTGLKKLPKYLFNLHKVCATTSVVRYVFQTGLLKCPNNFKVHYNTISN